MYYGNDAMMPGRFSRARQYVQNYDDSGFSPMRPAPTRPTTAWGEGPRGHAATMVRSLRAAPMQMRQNPRMLASRAAEAAYEAELAAQEAEQVAQEAAYAADMAADAADRASMPAGRSEMELLERLLQLVDALPQYEAATTAAGRPAVQMVSTLLQSAALAAKAAVMAATTPGAAELLTQVGGSKAAAGAGGAGGTGGGVAGMPSAVVAADPDAPVVMTAPPSHSAPDDGTSDQTAFSVEQVENEAASQAAVCNAATEEEVAALETAAAEVATGGKFVTSSGWGITGTPGAIGIQYMEQSAAEELVKGATDQHFGFLTIDANPEGYPKILCNNTFPMM